MKSQNPEDEFDLRARAEFSLAYQPGEIPEQLFRHTPLWARRGVQSGLVALVVLCLVLGSVFVVRPPELVRAAIEHEFYERTLRGNFMEAQPLLAHLGLEPGHTLPGYPQLMRPCEIDGKLAYHLTTFLEKGGMVTVFAFDYKPELKETSGWWANVYWQVVPAKKDGKQLIMVAQQKKALVLAQLAFAKLPA